MAVELCLSSRLVELFGDRLAYGSTTVELNESTFNDASLTALYFVPSGNDDETPAVQTQGRALRDLYKTVNETEKTLNIIQVCYPDKSDERKDYDELTNNVPWHSVLYDYAEKRVSQNRILKPILCVNRKEYNTSYN